MSSFNGALASSNLGGAIRFFLGIKIFFAICKSAVIFLVFRKWDGELESRIIKKEKAADKESIKILILLWEWKGSCSGIKFHVVTIGMGNRMFSGGKVLKQRSFHFHNQKKLTAPAKLIGFFRSVSAPHTGARIRVRITRGEKTTV